MSADLEAAISAAWDNRASVTPASQDVREPVEAALELLDSGQARVAEPDGQGGWKVNQWLKQAVLLSFRLNENVVIEQGAAIKKLQSIQQRIAESIETAELDRIKATNARPPHYQ